MKPLPSAPLTLEDFCIYGRQAQKWGRLYGMSTLELYQPADHLDAELMFRIEVCRRYEASHAEEFREYGYGTTGWVHHALRMTLQGHRIGFTGSDITYRA